MTKSKLSQEPLKLIRRNTRSSRPPAPFIGFCRHYSLFSSFYSPSSSFFSISSVDKKHSQRDDSRRGAFASHFLSLHNYQSSPRRFSTQPQSDELFLPVRAVISMFDYYHDATGFPWWVIISSSTLALRFAIFPVIVLQLKKMKRIGELLPKLPPPFPPPLSGRSFRDQITLFFREKKAAGCPSVFWFFSSLAVQVPCFFLWLMSVRRMSLDHHPGFDCGGALWFLDLTEYPHGVLGPVFPLLIAGLHFTLVQISFQNSSLQDLPGTLGLLAKFYGIYLQMLTLPILLATFNVPQGSLVYWLTNSSLSLIQMLCLRHPDVLEYLGLPLRRKNDAVIAPSTKGRGNTGVADIVILTKEGEISANSLSPEELFSYAVKILTDGRKDAAIRILKLALEKDPGCVKALLILGQTLMQNQQLHEATECLENSVSKLLTAGYPTKADEVDLLILCSQWAGIANFHQGKMNEGLVHLERIAHLEEPEDSKGKAHYYDGLLVLSSALLNVERKTEALNYMQKVVAYNPEYRVHLEQLETYHKDFASDLASSRRDF